MARRQQSSWSTGFVGCSPACSGLSVATVSRWNYAEQSSKNLKLRAPTKACLVITEKNNTQFQQLYLHLSYIVPYPIK